MNVSRHPPVFVQSDAMLLVEAAHPEYEIIKETLTLFAELVKTPGHIHVYRMSPVSLWQAAASGWTGEKIVGWLEKHAAFGVPTPVRAWILTAANRYGLLRLIRTESGLRLVANEPGELQRLLQEGNLTKYVIGRPDGAAADVDPAMRGAVKRELANRGYPVIDEAGYDGGERLDVALNERLSDGTRFRLRDYQLAAADAFMQSGQAAAGNGVVVLPCGAGKTIVGIAVMSRLQCATLILTTNAASVKQWIREIVGKTNLSADDVGEYTGRMKQVRPVTVATYHILTHRRNRSGDFPHMRLFHERDWGLIIYDEAHLLPAPVFRMTAELQAKRRLGLTATPVREDGRDADMYSLIGPKCYDIAWKRLEKMGWIAAAEAAEVRVPLPAADERRYAAAAPRERMRIAAENDNKLPVARRLLERHPGEPALVIGHFIGQLRKFSRYLQAPLICGETPDDERERLYEQFRRRQFPVLVVSKVANFSIDLPDASVAVQVSGSFGSRQEEAQRLGRLLRPKSGGGGAHFYSLVSSGTVEEEYAHKRQLFLTEQGYSYRVLHADDLTEGDLAGDEALRTAGAAPVGGRP